MVDFMLIFSSCLIAGLTSILIKMGTTIKYEDIDIKLNKRIIKFRKIRLYIFQRIII